MTKKNFVTTIIIAILLIIFATYPIYDSYYITNGIVTNIKTNTNTITFIDHNGEEWNFEGTNHKVNDSIIVIIKDNSPYTLYDNEIIDVINF